MNKNNISSENFEMRFAQTKEEALEAVQKIIKKYKQKAFTSKTGGKYDIIGFINEAYNSELYKTIQIHPIILCHHGKHTIAIHTTYKSIAEKYGIVDFSVTYSNFHCLHRTHLLKSTPTSTEDEYLIGCAINVVYSNMNIDDAMMYVLYKNNIPKKININKLNKLIGYYNQYKHQLEKSVKLLGLKPGTVCYKCEQAQQINESYLKIKQSIKRGAKSSKEAKTDLICVSNNKKIKISLKKNFDARIESSDFVTFISMVESSIQIPKSIEHLWNDFRKIAVSSTEIIGITITDLKQKDYKKYCQIHDEEYKPGTALLQSMFEICPDFQTQVAVQAITGLYKFEKDTDVIPDHMLVFDDAYTILFYNTVQQYLEHGGNKVICRCNSKSRKAEIKFHVHISGAKIKESN